MNEQIKQLLDQAQELARTEIENTPEFAKYAPSYAIPGTEIHVGLRLSYEKFAELIVRECARLNRLQSYELMGVITDVEEGDGFDDVCLNTVKRVTEHLANDLKEHFGVEE